MLFFLWVLVRYKTEFTCNPIWACLFLRVPFVGGLSGNSKEQHHFGSPPSKKNAQLSRKPILKKGSKFQAAKLDCWFSLIGCSRKVAENLPKTNLLVLSSDPYKQSNHIILSGIPMVHSPNPDSGSFPTSLSHQQKANQPKGGSVSEDASDPIWSRRQLQKSWLRSCQPCECSKKNDFRSSPNKETVVNQSINFGAEHETGTFL